MDEEHRLEEDPLRAKIMKRVEKQRKAGLAPPSGSISKQAQAEVQFRMNEIFAREMEARASLRSDFYNL